MDCECCCCEQPIRKQEIFFTAISLDAHKNNIHNLAQNSASGYALDYLNVKCPSFPSGQAEFFGAEAGRGPPYAPGDPGDPLYHPGPPPPPPPPPGPTGADFVRASSDVQYVQYYKNGGAGGGGGAHLSPDSGIGGESAVVASE